MPDVNRFVETIKLKFDADKESLKKIERDVEQLTELKLFDEKDLKGIQEQLKSAQSLRNQLTELESAFEAIENLGGSAAKSMRKELGKEIKKIKKDLGETTFVTNIKKIPGELKDKMKDAKDDFISSFSSKILEGFKSVFTSAWKELKNILKFSRLSSADTRDLMFSYGFNQSQAYGWSKAMGALGFESEEDLFYATEQELSLFRDAFNKYSEKYNSLYDAGTFDTLREFEVEMAEFKEDFQLEIVQFFMDNKTELKAALKAIISLAEFTITALGKLVTLLDPNATTSSSQRAANTASIVQNYQNRAANIQIDNTFNNISKSDQGWLVKAGQNVWGPIKQAFQ